MVGNITDIKIRNVVDILDKWQNEKTITDMTVKNKIILEIENTAKAKATYKAIEEWRQQTTGYCDNEILLKILEIWKKWAYTKTAET